MFKNVFHALKVPLILHALGGPEVAKEEMKAAQGRLEEVRSRIGEEGKELRNLQKELDEHDKKLEHVPRLREDHTKRCVEW